jgi:hypothetical protein
VEGTRPASGTTSLTRARGGPIRRRCDVAGKRIGKVTHYFDQIGVAVLALTDRVRVGDSLHFLGHGTDFIQVVASMQIEHKSVEAASPGDDVALKVEQRVRPNDAVFKVEGA